MTTAPTPADTAPAVDLEWLCGPRWGAVAAYALALGLSRAGVLQPMPWIPIAAGAALTVASNLALMGRGAPATARLTLAVLGSDVVLLTAVLYLSGGASNPLTALYLIPIALAAMLSSAPWAWAVTALSITAFGLLFFAEDTALVPPLDPAEPLEHATHGAHAEHAAHAGHAAQAPHASHAAHSGHFSSHLRGMWVAFALTAVSVAYFITRVTAALRRRERELNRTRTRALRAERVAALASLAGSTAHELGTPLASIRLAATEMERALERGAGTDTLLDDVRLVADQANRCRQILDAMLVEAGQWVGEAPVEIGLPAIVEGALALVPAAERARVDVELDTSLPRVRVPRSSLTQSLHNLVRNALDASPSDGRVALRVQGTGDRISITVRDHGVGMGPEQLSEAMEPFVTTKSKGQGLGLFLARSIAERLGGQLVLTSTPGQGTEARMELELEAASSPRGA